MRDDRGRPVAGSASQVSEEILLHVFEASPSAMLLVDVEGRIRMANPHCATVFGRPRESLIGLLVETLVPPRFRALHPEHRVAFFRAPSVRAMGEGRDLFGLRADGSEFPLEIGLNPIRTADGVFVLAVIIDLTARKMLEESLRLAEERQRAVIEVAPNAMVMVAEDGRILLVNAQAEQLFGWPRERLLGRPVEMLVPDRYRAHHPGQRRGWFAAPAARRMGAGRDLHGLRADGREVPIEIGLSPMRTRDGLFVLASIIDITQRKRDEDALRASLVEKELLLREIHHRVKNNMQVVSSMLSLQLGVVDDPRYRAMFEECQARVRAMALIHEKLYATGNLASLDCGEYLTELAQMLVRSYAEQRTGVRLAIETARVAIDIQTAIPIGLILNELVTNSLKHAFHGRREGVITIRLATAADGRSSLLVADDGPGLPPSLEPLRSRGLGLRMVRGLVRQIDGELTIQPGRGAGFLVRFGGPARAAGHGQPSPPGKP